MSKPNELAVNASFEFDALREAVCYRQALLSSFSPWLGAETLEVGAGVGQFTELLAQQEKVHSLTAVEPGDSFCAELRKKLPQAKVFCGVASDLPEAFSADTIVSINVLEHIEEDVRELELYRRILGVRAGYLCLFVPARPEIYAPVDRDFGHFRRYTRPGLKRQLESAGFRLIQLHYFNCVGYLAWWLGFCVLRRNRFDAASVRFYDRVIFPPVHWCETHLMRPPIGQSLLAVAQAGEGTGR